MISYIKGEITYKSPTYLLVETGGIGYHINISLTTYSKIQSLEKVKLLTYFLVKEDSQTLYGFESGTERQLFTRLISVSGVGSSTAMIMLSAMSPEELRAAIIGENILALKKIKGIGDRTAKRIILDLKDKLMKESGDEPLLLIQPASNTAREEALKALVTLGFMKIKVQKALNKILKMDPTITKVEVLIKRALKLLS
jgi:Holliday junction DNA helicase RuvA